MIVSIIISIGFLLLFFLCGYVIGKEEGRRIERLNQLEGLKSFKRESFTTDQINAAWKEVMKKNPLKGIQEND